ncbi:MAG: disulfide bond formation protein B [Pseudomonadota bacterium]
MSRARLITFAASGSAALLAGAFIFQALGYAPCQMCYWQRWPHAAAAGIGALYALMPLAVLPWLGALSAAATGALGVFHAGVEQDWWAGPASCSGGGGLGGLSGDDLLSVEAAGRVVMCDEIAWQFAGLSMAGWNAVFSFALMALWFVAARSVQR